MESAQETYRSLVRETVDDRGGGPRKPIAIIIVTYKSNELVQKSLQQLQRQTAVGKFDLVLVYGNEDKKIEGKHGFGIVHIFPSANSGPAGGFFIGERFALDSGYEKIIHLESDVEILTGNLVEELDKAANGMQAATPMLQSGDGSMLAPSYMHLGVCVPCQILKEVGLTYAPFNFGGEDSSLYEKVKWKHKIAVCEKARVSHLTYSRISHPNRAYNDIRGPLIASMPWLGFWPFSWRVFRELLSSVANYPVSGSMAKECIAAVLGLMAHPDRMEFWPKASPDEFGMARMKTGGRLPSCDIFVLHIIGAAKPDDYAFIKQIEREKLLVLRISGNAANRMAARAGVLANCIGKSVATNYYWPLLPLAAKQCSIVDLQETTVVPDIGLFGRLWIAGTYALSPLIFIAALAISAICFATVRPEWKKRMLGYGLTDAERGQKKI